MAKRVYAVKEIKRLMTRAADASAPTAMGGAAIMATKPHRHDGPEHTDLLPIERISTAETDPTLVAAPDGSGGVAFRAGAPTGADYLTGTAQAGLSAEIVVGTTPGGELGGTWASPTVDATHSGSAHLALGATSSTAAPGNHDHWKGSWSAVTAYVAGDMVSLDGASWVCVLANTALMPMSPDYREAMVGTTPVSYWRVGEAVPGTGTAADVMAANAGTYVGSPASVAGLLAGDSDTAIGLDGTLRYLSTGIFPGNTDTTMVWFKTSGAGSGYRTLAQRGGVYYIFLNSNVLTIFDGATLHAIGASLADGQPHQAALARQAGVTNGTIVYLDGVPVLTTTLAVSGTLSDLLFGHDDGTPGRNPTAAVDEPAIWNRAVTPAEIAGLNAVGTGTVVWERIEGATGSTGATGAVSAATSLDLTDQGSDPSAPGSGEHLLYTKSGGVYVRDPGGTVVGPLGTGGGGATALPPPVQQKSIGTNGSTAAITFDATPASTSLMLAQFTVLETHSVSSITQTNVTWTSLRTKVNGACRVELWKGVPTGTPGTLVTANLSAAGTDVMMYVQEWPSSAGLAGTVDQAHDNSGTGLPAMTAGNQATSANALTVIVWGQGSGATYFAGHSGPFYLAGVPTFGLAAYGWAGTTPVVSSVASVGAVVWANMVISIV